MLKITEEIQDLILRRASYLEISRTALASGLMRGLRRDAVDKALTGRISLEEACRVARL